MAKSKVQRDYTRDRHGTPCLKVWRKSGKLTEKDVYEALDPDYQGCLFVKIIEIKDEVPIDMLDDPGDTWLLYEPSDIIGSLLEWTGGYYEGMQR